MSSILSSAFRRICLIAAIALLLPAGSLARSRENFGQKVAQKAVLSDIVIAPHSPRGSVPSKGELNSSAGT